MASNNSTLVPKLRFGEFDGEWEEKRLNDITLINPKSEDLPNEFVYLDLESVVKGSLVKKSIISKDGAPSRAQRLLKRGDILYQTVRPYQNNNYLFNPVDNLNYVSSTGYAQIRTNESNGFLYQILNSKKFTDKVLVRCTGTSYPAINSNDLKKIKLNLPTLPEQQKIASFLTSVDKRIQLLQQKKQALEQYKKGAMQQIFSQQLRFKPNATDAEELEVYPNWEEKKLGEVCDIKTGNSNRQDSGLKGKYTFFDRSQDIRTSDIFLFDGEAIIVAGEGQEFIPKYFKGKFDLHQRTYCIMGFRECNGTFLYYLISKKRHYFESQAVGSTVKSLRLPMFVKMKLDLPCLEEQQKIAAFLSKIDASIAQVSTAIQQTQEFKKGLLQQLFV